MMTTRWFILKQISQKKYFFQLFLNLTFALMKVSDKANELQSITALFRLTI
jgi:hypothetical protein